MNTMHLRKLRILLATLALLVGFNAHAQSRKDTRSPLVGGAVLMKDLSNETIVPSLELEQVLSALAQNDV